MSRTVAPGERYGSVRIPASKSQAHRLLICAALGAGETLIECDGISKDIAATIGCLNALGADIREDRGALRVRPLDALCDAEAQLYCGESGSTLRFLLPLVGALGVKAVFHMEGRLPERPLAPLDRELCSHGMSIEREGSLLHCGGRLTAGDYTLPGNVSSQYISGLLMALPTAEGDSRLNITGNIESSAYISMTEEALKLSGIEPERTDLGYIIRGGRHFCLPEKVRVEGDYSNGAFFLSMGALSERGISVYGLEADSAQGDKAILNILRSFGAEVEMLEQCICVRGGRLRGCVIDAAPIPDLIPVLSVVAAAAEGETRVINAARLRLKESDRLSSTSAMLRALGADVQELPDGLVIQGGGTLCGGRVDTCRDHRIAMSAAVAACAAAGEVTVLDEDCVQKSYPRFWRDFDGLNRGGRE